jgi:NADH:ubiquinone oxidoreductase subunit F (NADH-binding)
MTTAGLTVLHSSPHQLRTEPQRIIAQVEACYLRDRGKGLPAGVKLVRT